MPRKARPPPKPKLEKDKDMHFDYTTWLKVGMVFASMALLKGSISLYAYNTKQPFKTLHNDAILLHVKCARGCKYVIKARGTRGGMTHIVEIGGGVPCSEGRAMAGRVYQVSGEVLGGCPFGAASREPRSTLAAIKGRIKDAYKIDVSDERVRVVKRSVRRQWFGEECGYLGWSWRT